MAGGDLAPRMREPEIAKTVWNSGAYTMKSSRILTNSKSDVLGQGIIS